MCRRSYTEAPTQLPTAMAGEPSTDPPLLQRLYDRIWLLALAALLFWALSYVLWGVLDVLSTPGVAA